MDEIDQARIDCADVHDLLEALWDRGYIDFEEDGTPFIGGPEVREWAAGRFAKVSRTSK